MKKEDKFQNNDNDFTEIIHAIIQHKFKFISLCLLGFIFGLGVTYYTYQEKPKYKTFFKYNLSYPGFDNDFLYDSNLFQKKLNEGELNSKIIPSYRHDKRRNQISVITHSDDVYDPVVSMLQDALKIEIKKLKELAKTLNTNEPAYIISNSKAKGVNLRWTNQDIAKIDSKEVIDSLEVAFSQTKTLYPHPMKYGLIGAFIGLVSSFLWFFITIFISTIRKKN
jgi:hypothetical protein